MTPAQLLVQLGLSYREKSNRLEMLCPFHDDTNPSAGFYLDTHKFFCYTCTLSLDMTGFYAKHKGITREEALRVVQEKERKPLDRMALARAKSELDFKRIASGLNFGEHMKVAEWITLVMYGYEHGRLTLQEFNTVVEEMLGEDWSVDIKDRSFILRKTVIDENDPEFMDLA